MDENTTTKVEKTAKRFSKIQQDVADFFSSKDNLGIVVTPKDYCTKKKRTRQWFQQGIGNLLFAQLALEANQDSPLPVKIYYESMINKSLAKYNSETVFATSSTIFQEQRQHQFVVSKDQLMQELINVKSDTSGEPVAILRTRDTERTTAFVSENDALLKRVRDEYIMAPLGDTPDIGEICKRVGIKLRTQDVRKIALDENWRAERSNYLHQSLDLVPEEVKLVTMLRTVETHKMLYQHIKILHRQHMQYYNTGRVVSVDGTTDLKFRPDPGAISALAETMRRIVDGSSSVNILINNQANKTQIGSINGVTAALPGDTVDASLLTRKYVQQVIKMTPEELEKEIDNLTKLRELVENKTVIDAELAPG
jgi:hypothetical protein